MPGLTQMQVRVDELIPQRATALCTEASTGKQIEVQILPLRVRMPAVGERWLIDRTFTGWSFAALLTSPTVFTGTGTDTATVNSLIDAKLDGVANAYDVATNNGFVGTQAEWLASLHGADGAAGPAGPQGATGPAGATGPTGPAGPRGADSTVPGPEGPQGLTGPQGPPGADSTVPGPPGPANTLSIGTVTTGAAGSAASASVTGTAPNQTLNLSIPKGDQGAAGMNGADGPSAYQVAVNNGFVGTQAQWLASLQGATGPAGAQGPAGPTGPAGAQGPAGPTGATGPAGPTGPAGADGTFAYIGSTPPPGDASTWTVGQLWVDTGTVL